MPVWAVLDFSNTEIIERELLLIKVSVTPGDPKEADPYHFTPTHAVDAHLKRQAVTELTSLFGGKIVDLSLTHCTIELSDESRRVDGFIHMLKPFGIIEASRSGVMAIARSPFDGMVNRKKGGSEEEEEVQPQVDVSQLPPS